MKSCRLGAESQMNVSILVESFRIQTIEDCFESNAQYSDPNKKCLLCVCILVSIVSPKLEEEKVLDECFLIASNARYSEVN